MGESTEWELGKRGYFHQVQFSPVNDGEKYESYPVFLSHELVFFVNRYPVKYG